MVFDTIFLWVVFIREIIFVSMFLGCFVMFCIISIGLFRLGVFFCRSLESVSIRCDLFIKCKKGKYDRGCKRWMWG